MASMISVISIIITFLLGFFITKFSRFIEWAKWIASYISVKVYKKCLKRRFDLYDYSRIDDPVKINFLIPREEYHIDGPQSETHLLTRDDEIFFYGANSKSEVLIAKINRRWNNRAEASLYLKLSSGKVYHLEKTVDFQKSCTDDLTFSCGNFQLQCLAPMRRWRLYYAGYLRETNENNQEINRMTYVKFALLWKAASDAYDFQTDINAKTLAGGLANASWRSPNPQVENLYKALDYYGQAGTIHGTVSIEEEFEDKEFYFFGQRIRYLGNTNYLEDFEFYHTLGYVKENGAYLHLGDISAENIVKDFTFGFFVQPDADIKDAQSISTSKFNNENIQLKFKTDKMSFIFNSKVKDLFVNKTHKNINIKWIEFTLNGKSGYGIQIKRSTSTRVESEHSVKQDLSMPSNIPLVLRFDENHSQFSDISGGKGSSLGKLSQISHEHQTFCVPQGIVVTTFAYKNFVTKSILEEIKTLEQKLYKEEYQLDDVSLACKRLSEVIIQTEVPQALQVDIMRNLNILFGEKFESKLFAVRSSATGEDTEQMSAAGQMETFLGVSGINEILFALKKCWASQFSFVAIEYKRRHGQSLNSHMAVVIQEMISCDVAGVIFTCDPLTGNPTLMSITSNYGLGETVVSGSEEPDLIELKRDENDQVSIKNVTIGQKKRKIVTGGEQGTDVVDVSENERNSCSITNEMILQLADAAVKIEKHYRSQRDIEWGFYNKKLYIFQSRPVTSGTEKTNFEIDHEYDTAMRVENDFYSVANVGEVLPNALSPLGSNALFKSFGLLLGKKKKEVIFQLRNVKNYFEMGWIFMYGHFLYNVADLFPQRPNEELSALKKSTIISFYGRIPENEEMYEVTKARYDWIPEPNPLTATLTLIKTTYKTSNVLKTALEKFSGYRIPIENFNSSKELYDYLLKSNAELDYVIMCHMITTQTSSLWNMLLLSILGAAHGELNDIVYRDFANLLKTNSEVESADVPSATQSIAYYISQVIKPEDFKKMSTKEAHQWLLESDSIAGKKFREFMERHGHRCLMEFDVYSHPWRETPEVLVQLLQGLAGTISKDVMEKKPDSWNDMISKLNVKLGYFYKLLIKMILPLNKKYVQAREMSKSLFIKSIDEWRKGYWHLAELMVKEGRIPDKELLFFMNFNDIRCLLETRSPKIISDAAQRKRRFPIIKEYRFPEICKGFPIPFNKEETEVIINDVNFSMKGIPVSQGVVKGFIRKAVTLEEAVSIQPGEILLTYSTDIGWTPYFPHLAGVVTELGGLISHGAVVSREYGIPCIAGLHGATKQFQTGDYVILDGNKGVLQKLPIPES